MKDDGLRKLGNAFATIAFMLWGVFPMLVLGWLVAAIGRHPVAEEAIKDEPVYSLLLWWKGGTGAMGLILILIVVLVALIVLSYVFRKYEFSHAHDGMRPARPLIQKFLVPSFLSSSAFAAGILSKETTSGHLWGAMTLLGFAVVLAVILYIVDVTKKVK